MGTERIRSLAVDIRPRQFGFAAFEGATRLVDWGVVRNRCDAIRTRRFVMLIKQCDPALLVIANIRGREHRRTAARGMCTVARAMRLPVRYVSRAAGRRFFLQYQLTTKAQIAVALADWFPELKSKLPQSKKIWQSEHWHAPLFDAVALGIVHLAGMSQAERSLFAGPQTDE